MMAENRERLAKKWNQKPIDAEEWKNGRRWKWIKAFRVLERTAFARVKMMSGRLMIRAVGGKLLQSSILVLDHKE